MLGTVDAAQTDRAIKVAVIKQVDREDVADDKSDDYVAALFDGALKRAKRGDAAITGARVVIEEARKDAADPKPADGPKFASESEAKENMRTANRSAWHKETR